MDKQKSTAKIEIRLTDTEKKLIQSYAKEDGLTVTDYVKTLALKQVLFSKRLEYTSDLRTVIFEINKIGNNINQIAKHVNRTEKYKTIDAGTINVFHIFMRDYLKLLADVKGTLKQMYKKISTIR